MGRQAVKQVDKKVWTLPELAEEVGLEYRTAYSWMERGLLVPSTRPTGGTGHPSLFDHRDVKTAAYLTRLRELGLSMDGLEAASVNPEPLMNELKRWSDFHYRRTAN